MRFLAPAALALALAACGGGEGEELAAGNSQLSEAQVDAALGPADQSIVQDANANGTIENGVELTANEASGPVEEDEQ